MVNARRILTDEPMVVSSEDKRVVGSGCLARLKVDLSEEENVTQATRPVLCQTRPECAPRNRVLNATARELIIPLDSPRVRHVIICSQHQPVVSELELI